MIEGASINVNSLMDGDERAFQGLFVDYYSVLVSFAMKYLDANVFTNQRFGDDPFAIKPFAIKKRLKILCRMYS